MVVFGTQMDVVTFVFVNIELVIFFYLVIYKTARPDDSNANLNIVLIFLLLLYNITGGLLPDEKLPGSYFVQECIAYGTGFITPSYFPYYVYRAFSLSRMRFHALKGILIFLVLPYLLFIILFAITNKLKFSQNLLVLPVFYAGWVILSLYKSIRFKYRESIKKKDEKQELFVLLVSLTPWIGLPIITYFDWGQATEALITNLGFLLLFGLQVNRSVTQIRIEHERLIESEKELLNWNEALKDEVERRTDQLAMLHDQRTNELARLHEQRINTLVNLVHETKTPITLIQNYLEEYIEKNGSNKELDIIKGGVDKLTNDVINLFDIQRFEKGMEVYRHNLVTSFSSILKDSFPLFEYYCQQQGILCNLNMEEHIYIKADGNAISRIVNNIVENAIKFTNKGGTIEISLNANEDNLIFSVSDTGVGIHSSLHKKIFEPYFQINSRTTSLQGMGLGLPIVKKVVDDLDGEIFIEDNPSSNCGTRFAVILRRYYSQTPVCDISIVKNAKISSMDKFLEYNMPEIHYSRQKSTLLIVEDNKAMLHFLSTRLMERYNVFFSYNGVGALKRLNTMPVKPDLILSDFMMDEMDGDKFITTLSIKGSFSHIPVIFLTAKATPADRLKGLKLGAVDYIAKPFSLGELIHKIDAVLITLKKQRKAILNASIESLNLIDKLESLSPDSSRFEQNCKLFNLTVRETEIVQLMVSGMTYKGIATELFISERTVTKHVQNIFEKTAVTNKLTLLNKLNK